jgi:hypothetical protein
VANFATNFASVFDTGGKFANGEETNLSIGGAFCCEYHRKFLK